ncbi:nucleoside diphosphate-linked moiety X motif 19 [Caerostris extrusa]|uniref:Nucleoside diphosphate-linked moiety X motif 19 n=1 Tax=Caerostris extrusa TaxID=172846 RepID=A0AAV4NI31_CAEEX|nr:nucleoside diphosphate-linked moiety X motif 19 [Caerostris extrusa]
MKQLRSNVHSRQPICFNFSHSVGIYFSIQDRDGDRPPVARGGQRDDRGSNLATGAGGQQPGQHDAPRPLLRQAAGQQEPLRLPPADGQEERAQLLHGQRLRVPGRTGGDRGLLAPVVLGLRGRGRHQAVPRGVRLRCGGPAAPHHHRVRHPAVRRGAAAPAECGGGPLPPDVALRIAAVRETFEETGVLLMARGGPSSSPPSSWYEGVDVVSWQERIRRDPLAFADFCLEARVCPDIWSLHEWWDWLTPTSVGHRRYDTMFYVCCLEKQPDVVLDHSEVVTLKWCTPEEMLEEHSTNAVFLAPPQVYELSRLLHFSSFQALRSFAGERARKGVQRWLPVIVTCMDGAISLLPGDEMYPRKPDYLGKSPGPDYPASVDEMRKRHSGIHRIEVRGPICTARCTVSPPCGHLQPLTYRPDGPLVQSYL